MWSNGMSHFVNDPSIYVHGLERLFAILFSIRLQQVIKSADANTQIHAFRRNTLGDGDFQACGKDEC